MFDHAHRFLSSLLVLAACWTSLPAADGQPKTGAVGAKPVSASATAHDPHYSDRKAWPADVMKSFHAQESWPKGRQWTWAKPGVSVGEQANPLDPKYWLESGKVASIPFDENTDFDFPEAATRYFVAIKGEKNPITWRRHLTVGKNANVSWQHGAKGNTWIRDGGRLTVLSWIGGDKHAFLRNDNTESWWMVDHIFFCKAPKASIEILGSFSVDDSFHFSSGMTILGVDSCITPQARSNLNVQQDASLVMLSGAKYHKQGNQSFACDLVVRGKLMAGLPERPLTKDANLGLSWKGKRRFLGGTNMGFRSENNDDVGLIVMPAFNRSVYIDGKGWTGIPMSAGSLKVFSTDPLKARLVLDWNGLDVSGESSKGGPENQANFEKLKTVTDTYIEMMLLGDVDLNGVLFNHVAKEGIVVVDPAVAAAHKNIQFGPKNQGKPNELFKKWDGKEQSLFKNTTDF